MQHNNTTKEQTTNEQVSTRGTLWLMRRVRQVERRAMRATLHEHNKHSRRCWQLYSSFQYSSTSGESTSIDTEHIDDENSTKRVHQDAQCARQQARTRVRAARERTKAYPCTLP